MNSTLSTIAPHEPVPPKYVHRTAPIAKVRFLKAIKGSAGIHKEIARRLSCHTYTVGRLLRKPGWEDVAEAYQDEVERVADESEIAIYDAIRQRHDLRLAAENARWMLERLRPNLYRLPPKEKPRKQPAVAQQPQPSKLIKLSDLPEPLRGQVLHAWANIQSNNTFSETRANQSSAT